MNSKTIGIGIGFGLVGVAALAGLLVRQIPVVSSAQQASAGAQAGQNDSSVSRQQAQAAQIARLSREVASLRLAMVERPSAPLARAPEEGEESGAAANKAEPARDYQQEAVNRIETQFAEEARDPAWNASPQIRGKLSAVLPSGSQLRELDCQSSLCRMETTHRSLDAYHDFVARGFGHAEDDSTVWPGSVTFSVQEDPAHHGEVVAVAYLLRPGHQFPNE
jgi:hypothetical protein